MVWPLKIHNDDLQTVVFIDEVEVSEFFVVCYHL